MIFHGPIARIEKMTLSTCALWLIERNQKKSLNFKGTTVLKDAEGTSTQQVKSLLFKMSRDDLIDIIMHDVNVEIEFVRWINEEIKEEVCKMNELVITKV